jgi:hypothetical protein
MFPPTPHTKALLAVFLFSLSSIAGAFARLPVTPDMIPLLVFHALLLINTFFSIRCFAAITPQNNMLQNILDSIIGGIYLAIPFAFHSPLLFVSGTALLFTVATLKYIFLQQLLGGTRLLRRKLVADAGGAVLCLAALGGIWLGYTALATALWVGIFFCANIYLLIIAPLYKHDS